MNKKDITEAFESWWKDNGITAKQPLYNSMAMRLMRVMAFKAWLAATEQAARIIDKELAI